MATAMVFTVAVGSQSAAAKAHGGDRPPVKAQAVLAHASPAVMAHATGHKIA